MSCFSQLELSWSQGYDGQRLRFVDKKTAISVCGCTMKLTDTTTGKERSFKSGINPFGVFAVSPQPK